MLVDVYAERKYADVMRETWGHLAPQPRSYEGWMVFFRSAYPGDGAGLIDAEFIGLDDSPWLYDEMQEWISRREEELKEGGVYRFTGTYTKFASGSYRFSGRSKRIPVK